MFFTNYLHSTSIRVEAALTRSFEEEEEWCRQEAFGQLQRTVCRVSRHKGRREYNLREPCILLRTSVLQLEFPMEILGIPKSFAYFFFLDCGTRHVEFLPGRRRRLR